MLLKNAIILSEGITSSSAADGVSVSASKVRLGHAAAGTGASDFTANRYLYLAGFSLQIGGTAGNDLYKFSGAGLATFTNDGLGATQVDTRGHLLQNNTAAAAGAQQYSPATIWAGKGWKTTAVAASQDVRFRAYTVPVQGAANPTATWILESSINSGSYANSLTYNSAGELYIPSKLGVGLSSGLLATIHGKGSGATSATNTLYLANSAGNMALTVKDDLSSTFRTGFKVNSNGSNGRVTFQNTYNHANAGIYFADNTNNLDIGYKFLDFNVSQYFTIYNSGGNDVIATNAGVAMHYYNGLGQFSFNGAISASAQVSITSTTRGFLGPRMTTAQFAAIATKATGLEAYSADDLGKLWYDGTRIVGFRYNGTKFQGYDGASWLDLN